MLLTTAVAPIRVLYADIGIAYISGPNAKKSLEIAAEVGGGLEADGQLVGRRERERDGRQWSSHCCVGEPLQVASTRGARGFGSPPATSMHLPPTPTSCVFETVHLWLGLPLHGT